MQTASGCVARPADVVTLANLTRFSRGSHANQTAASRQNLPVIEGEAEGPLAIWVFLIIVLAAIGLTAWGCGHDPSTFSGADARQRLSFLRA
jgi:hypothetical protein